MNTNDRGLRLKTEPRAVKREPGALIKSEFGPSLASLPMAPAKKEYGENKKPLLGSIPQHRASRNRHRGSHLVYRVNGYYIRAHYGHGQVDFFVQKDSPKCRDLDWKEVEREIFRKFHAARFFIEPTERPYKAIQNFSFGAASSTLRFSVRARRVEPRMAPLASFSENVDLPAGFDGIFGAGVKDEKKPLFDWSKMFSRPTEDENKKVVQDSATGISTQPELVYPAASLPANLPEIASYSMSNSDNAKFAARRF